MDNKFYMGVDIGTSGVKAAIFDIEGKQVEIASAEYPMISTESGMSELSPDMVFSSFLSVIKKCIEMSAINNNLICGIGLSTQIHSFLALDKDGDCLTNLITWADTRSIGQANYIKEEFNYVEMYNLTGCRVQHPMYPLSKILWLKATRPDLYNKVYKFVSIKEYIIYKLSGKYLIDITDASSTACFNIHEFIWEKSIFHDVLKIDESMLGEPVQCSHVIEGIRKIYIEQMGLSPDTRIIIGSGDGMLANLGCGVFDDTSVTSTIGTSGALRISTEKPLLDENQRTWCYCLTKDTWVAGGAINNGGIVLRWLRDTNNKQFEQDMKDEEVSGIYRLFDKYAAEINPGCDGLIFLPYLTGERALGWNAAARGTLHGFQLIHGRKHIIRAAMEGVIYNMYSIYRQITQMNNNVMQIKANGGYANSDIWLQIQADIFGKEIAVAGVIEATVFGAAYIAMAALGAVKNLKTPLPSMEPMKVIEPDILNHKFYIKEYEKFRELYSKIYNN